jgi:hypothetical protein
MFKSVGIWRFLSGLSVWTERRGGEGDLPVAAAATEQDCGIMVLLVWYKYGEERGRRGLPGCRSHHRARLVERRKGERTVFRFSEPPLSLFYRLL